MANRYYQPPIARPTQEEKEIIDLLSPLEKKEALLYFGRAKYATLGQAVISPEEAKNHDPILSQDKHV